MDVRATTDAPVDTGADTIVVGVFDGKGIPHDVSDGTLGALVESGEARSEFRSLAVAHAAGKRWILVGIGARDRFDGAGRRRAAVGLGAPGVEHACCGGICAQGARHGGGRVRRRHAAAPSHRLQVRR